MKFNEDEKIILKAADLLGYSWIAKDSDGLVTLFQDEPEKMIIGSNIISENSDKFYYDSKKEYLNIENRFKNLKGKHLIKDLI